MPKIKNISPLGALDVPLLGRDVAAGEVVEVTAEQAARLVGQTDVWEPVEDAPTRRATKGRAQLVGEHGPELVEIPPGDQQAAGTETTGEGE